MASTKANVLFLWLIVETVMVGQSFSLRNDEKDAPLPKLPEATVKKLDAQQNIPVENSANIHDLNKLLNRRFPLTANIPGVQTKIDPFERKKRAISVPESSADSLDKPESVDNAKCCKRHEFQLRFEDIGLNWILHPESVDIGVCKGVCSSENTLFATHNGKLRSLAYEKGLISAQEAPSCVPTEFRPITILYKDDNDVIQHGRLPDVVIENCECQ